MRVLILGAAGMLGHKLYQTYQDRFETWATLRGHVAAYERYALFDAQRIINGVDADHFDTVIRAVAEVKPEVVINCIGIIKQLKSAKDPLISLNINSLFPHRLAALCAAAGARMIHISTDCVFNGRKGMYTEDDPADAEDLYGRTKFLGEVSQQPHALTLRTSIIGRELSSSSGLVDWFLSNQGGQVQGYRQALYSGFSTLALAGIIADILENQPDLCGVWQLSSEVINKYDLLLLVKEAYQAQIQIDPYDDFKIDRSLDSSRFRAETNFTPPTWSQMIHEMAADRTPYEQWRS